MTENLLTILVCHNVEQSPLGLPVCLCSRQSSKVLLLFASIFSSSTLVRNHVSGVYSIAHFLPPSPFRVYVTCMWKPVHICVHVAAWSGSRQASSSVALEFLSELCLRQGVHFSFCWYDERWTQTSPGWGSRDALCYSPSREAWQGLKARTWSKGQEGVQWITCW